jgi:hypothetical protein
MYYEEMNPDIPSQFIKTAFTLANVTSESQLPTFGLFARNLLSEAQMNKVKAIRRKRFSTELQRTKFKED